MSMSDPIADMLTRIRNAQATEKVTVAVPASRSISSAPGSGRRPAVRGVANASPRSAAPNTGRTSSAARWRPERSCSPSGCKRWTRSRAAARSSFGIWPVANQRCAGRNR